MTHWTIDTLIARLEQIATEKNDRDIPIYLEGIWFYPDKHAIYMVDLEAKARHVGHLERLIKRNQELEDELNADGGRTLGMGLKNDF